jgi:hypothetical protein
VTSRARLEPRRGTRARDPWKSGPVGEIGHGREKSCYNQRGKSRPTVTLPSADGEERRQKGGRKDGLPATHFLIVANSYRHLVRIVRQILRSRYIPSSTRCREAVKFVAPIVLDAKMTSQYPDEKPRNEGFGVQARGDPSAR